MSTHSNPFAVLGLPEWPDLDDETVIAAWHAIATATHPDREGGGDLARYTQACAAFHELSTPWGRSEAYADLVDQAWADGRYDDYPDRYSRGPDPVQPPAQPWVLPPPMWLADPRGMLLDLPYRFRHGHPVRLLIRAAVIAGLCLTALALIPSPAAAHFTVAFLTLYFAGTARGDLAPSPRL
jgi:hypothetical protein